MQTRSMTKKKAVLSRSTSLEAPRSTSHPISRSVSMEDIVSMEDTATAQAPIEIVTSELARVDHVRDCGGEQRDQRARVQQEMLNIMQAQVIVQAATNRDNEARLQQAFAETEARLHATAQALVQAHTNEHALETRRGLGEAIQHALVDAHSRAHAQAMQAAQERLNQFTTEIHQRIQAQLADAVNEVGTKGVAYIEDVTLTRLDQLRAEAQSDLDKKVEQSITRALATSRSVDQGDDSRSEKQLMQIRADLSRQLIESEKRSYDSAVLSATSQAEKLIVQAEGRLSNDIGRRLAAIGSRADSIVSDAVVRAETHCNVVDKRTSDSLERALKDFRAARLLRKDVCVDRALEEKLGPRVESAVSKQLEDIGGQAITKRIQATVARLAEEAVRGNINDALVTKLDEFVREHFIAKIQPLVHVAVDDTVKRQARSERQAESDARSRGITAEELEGKFQQLEVKFMSRAVTIVNEAIETVLRTKIETVLRPAVNGLIAEANARVEAHFDRELRRCESVRSQLHPPLFCSAVGHARDQEVAIPKLQPSVDRTISLQVAKLPEPRKEINQVTHDIDFETGVIINPRAILASRARSVEQQPLRTSSLKAPSTLDATRTEEMQRFLREYDDYRKLGGASNWTAFVSPAVLQYLRLVECPDGYSDSQILSHLVRKVAEENQDVSVLERKFAEIKVDPLARTSKEKAESILVGVENVLLGLTTPAAMGGENNVTIPLKTLIGVVMEKLPRQLQERVDRRMRFGSPLQSRREFAEVLFDEAKTFVWPPSSSLNFAGTR